MSQNTGSHCSWISTSPPGQRASRQGSKVGRAVIYISNLTQCLGRGVGRVGLGWRKGISQHRGYERELEVGKESKGSDYTGLEQFSRQNGADRRECELLLIMVAVN